MDGTENHGLVDSIHDDGQPSPPGELRQSLLPYDVTEEGVIDPRHGGTYCPPVTSPGPVPWGCRSGAREIRPPKLGKGAIDVGGACGGRRGNSPMSRPPDVSHSVSARPCGLARRP